MKGSIEKVGSAYRAASTRLYLYARSHDSALMLMLGVALLAGGLAEISVAQSCTQNVNGTVSCTEAGFQDGLIRASVGNLFRLVEGAFGALIMVVAGLGAIVAAAMGAYRAAVGMLVVAVGAFILRALVSLFFGTDYVDFTTGGAGGAV